MWKVYAVLAIGFAIAALWDWRSAAPRQWRYNVAYSFQTGVGRIFVTRSAPIKSSEDVRSVEQFVIDENKRDGKAVENLFLTSWVELSTDGQASPDRP